MSTQREGLLTYEQAAARLGIAEKTLRNWVAARRIAFVRVSARCTRFDPADLDAYVEDRRVEEVTW